MFLRELTFLIFILETKISQRNKSSCFETLVIEKCRQSSIGFWFQIWKTATIRQSSIGLMYKLGPKRLSLEKMFSQGSWYLWFILVIEIPMLYSAIERSKQKQNKYWWAIFRHQGYNMIQTGSFDFDFSKIESNLIECTCFRCFHKKKIQNKTWVLLLRTKRNFRQ